MIIRAPSPSRIATYCRARPGLYGRLIAALRDGAPDLTDAPSLHFWAPVSTATLGKPVTEDDWGFEAGAIFGHPRFPSGRPLVNTSPLIAIDPGLRWAICASRDYSLGRLNPTVDGAWLRQFADVFSPERFRGLLDLDSDADDEPPAPKGP